MGVLPIFRHVDTIFKGIEMIAIRNGTLKRAELGSDWLCSGFSKSVCIDPVKVFLQTFRNEICTKRANCCFGPPHETEVSSRKTSF